METGHQTNLSSSSSDSQWPSPNKLQRAKIDELMQPSRGYVRVEFIRRRRRSRRTHQVSLKFPSPISFDDYHIYLPDQLIDFNEFTRELQLQQALEMGIGFVMRLLVPSQRMLFVTDKITWRAAIAEMWTLLRDRSLNYLDPIQVFPLFPPLALPIERRAKTRSIRG